MPLYENVFVARQDVAQTQVDALTQQYSDLVASLGGSVSKKEYWGLRQLAYRIKKNRKAHFMLLNIDAPPAAIAELERNQSINEDVIRFMTVRVDALDEEPSAMMRKDRDDRDGDRPGGDRPDRGDRGPRGPRREFGSRDRGDRPERPRFAAPSAAPSTGEEQ